MESQVVWMLGYAAPRQIIGCCHLQAPHLSHMQRHHARVREVADPDGEIEAFFHEIDDAIKEKQRDINARIGLQKIRHNGPQHRPAKGQRRRQCQCPGSDLGLAGDIEFGGVEIGQNAAGIFEKPYAGSVMRIDWTEFQSSQEQDHMSRIATLASIEASPEASRPLLEAVKKQFGSVPNLFRVTGVPGRLSRPQCRSRSGPRRGLQ